jgi:signal transduction histidine kinase
MPAFRRSRTTITVNDIKDTISRYLGMERTERSFQTFEEQEGHPIPGNAPASMETIRFSEQLLASAVGSSSARLILSLLVQRNDRSAKDAYRLLDDASDALQHNRDLLQIALDQMEQGITVFDKDLRLTCWNRQYRTLFDLPDELGQVGVSLGRILAFLAKRGDILQPEEAETLDRLTTFGLSWQLELRTSGRIIELRSNPMPDGGIVATYADITARVQADAELKRINETLEQRVTTRTGELVRVNEELAQAQKIAEEANLGKTRFLAAAGHDILQPLNAARLYCSSLIEKAGAGEPSEAARNIESSLESVETILGMVLDISRLDTGALKPSETVFRLDELLQQIATDFQPMAEAKRLHMTMVPSSLMVRTDRNMLRRVVQNLVSNAIKYTREGRILVGVRRRGELVEIQVFDSGIGIPEDKLNTVFREFTRLDEGVREAPGLGLGLSIVDRIARVLRLELHLQSLKGKGTRFSVILPVTHEAPQAAIVESTPGSGPVCALSGLSVLCIDNDPRIVEGMRLLLEGWGCAVRTASGSTVLDEQSSAEPDVILADYHLDGENGLELIARLRSRYGQDMPALLLTADRSEELKAMAERMEVGVLNKPIKPAALRAMLSRYRKVLSAAE